MDPAIQYLTVAGLAAVTWFIVPGAGDAALVAAALSAGQGNLDIRIVLISAFLGALIGGAVGFYVGLKGGRDLVLRPGRFLTFRQKTVAKGDKLLQRFGPISSVTALPLLCGVNRVPLATFVPFSTVGRLGWAVGTGLLAYYLGEAALNQLKQAGAPVIATILIGALIVFATYYLRVQRHPTTSSGATGDQAAPSSPPQ